MIRRVNLLNNNENDETEFFIKIEIGTSCFYIILCYLQHIN
jgi:hypothetical protein